MALEEFQEQRVAGVLLVEERTVSVTVPKEHGGVAQGGVREAKGMFIRKIDWFLQKKR